MVESKVLVLDEALAGLDDDTASNILQATLTPNPALSIPNF